VERAQKKTFRFREIAAQARNDIVFVCARNENLKKPGRDIEMSDKETPLEQQP